MTDTPRKIALVTGATNGIGIWTALGLAKFESAKPTTPAAKIETFVLPVCSDPKKPRNRDGAASVRKAVVGPSSPPTANPCSNRQTTIRIGAATPIW